MATGNRYWTAQTLECDFKIHGAAEKAGILMHYQGVLRHYAVVFSHGKLQLVRQYYGQQVLAEIPYILKDEEVIHIKVTRNCPDLQVEINGQAVLAVQDSTMDCGGCGFMVSHGLCGFDDLKINAQSK